MKRDAIITLPNPHLRAKSSKVIKITPGIRKLVQDMKSATLDWEDSRQHETGVALAAVQIDQLIKVIVIRRNFENKKQRSFDVFINPKITARRGETIEDFEGCLSVSDIYGKVERHSKIKLRAMNLKGQEFNLSAEGFLARVFQHEIDHTEGKLFIDHIKNKKDAFYRLDKDGKLGKLDYEKDIKDNSFLW